VYIERVARQLRAGRRGARARLGPGAADPARARARAGGQHAVDPAVGVEPGKKGGDRRGRGRRARRGDLAESPHGGGDRFLHVQLGEAHATVEVAEADVGLAVLVRGRGATPGACGYPLEGLHAEWLLREVLVDVRAVPHEPELAGAVECDLQREDIHHICGAARLHGAGRDPFGNCFRHETRVGERGWAVWEPNRARRAEVGGPF